MARPLRGLRGFGRKQPARTPPPPPPPATDERPAAGAPQAANGQGSTPVPAAAPAPRTAEPATPGVPPAGSAWPGAAPAVAPSPPSASAPSTGSPPSARPPGPPAGSPPPRRPAQDGGGKGRASDLTSIRRWQWVTAAWATAATVIAVLAFISSGNSDSQQIKDSAQQTQRAQQRLDRRVAALQAQVTALPQSGAITGVTKRINRLDKVTARQDRQLISLGTQQQAQAKGLTALEKRVATLEATSTQDKTKGTTTTP